MKTKTLPVFILITIIAVFLINNLNKRPSNSASQAESMPSVTQTYNQSASEEIFLTPTNASDKNNPQPKLSNTCRDGNTVRQNVKPCSSDLDCYSLTPMSERYCRLPDGTCKFFCTDK